MIDRISQAVRVILLDIEGTTTPVDYVFGVLFPYAEEQVEAFLQKHGQEEAVQADLKRLRQEYEADCLAAFQRDAVPQRDNRAENLPAWEGNAPAAAVPYIHFLIAIDRKSTGLKSLQGKIWNQGYQDGTLRSQIFPDVKPAFERWIAAGKRLYIFSSGSVQAQQLLFRYSEAGDLTQFLSDYFDTQIGMKREPESYHKIAATIEVPPAEILFVSDVVAELTAARLAGMQGLFSLRPGNSSSDSEGFGVVRSFDEI